MKRLITLCSLILMMATALAHTTPTTHCFVEGDEPLYLDHYRATGDGAHPCVLFAFGGGFSHGSRNAEVYLPYFNMLLELGFDVISIDYRLGMKFTLESNEKIGPLKSVRVMNRAVKYAAEDIIRATDYIHRNAVKMGIDISRIVVSGSSAGAIAALQAENYVVNRSRLAKILSADYNYAGVIAFAGAIYSVCGKPKWHHTPCPIMLFHGNADCNVPYYKATMLGVGFYGSAFIAEQIEKMEGASLYFHSATYRNHDMAIEPLSANHKEVAEFLQRCVIERKGWMKTVEVTNPDIEPTRTEFTIKEYLDANYANE